MLKKCPDCKLFKSFAEWRKNSGNKDGVGTYCKECDNRRAREKYGPRYYSKHKKAKRTYWNKWNITLNGRYSSIKKNAKYRKIEFKLTVEEFDKLTTQDCIYCNSKSGKTYVGLDRIDSSLSYKIGNVAPCCEICNKMKNILTVDKFKKHINKIRKRINNEHFEVQLHRYSESSNSSSN